MLRSSYHSIARALLCSLACPSQSQPCHVTWRSSWVRLWSPSVGSCRGSNWSQAECRPDRCVWCCAECCGCASYWSCEYLCMACFGKLNDNHILTACCLAVPVHVVTHSFPNTGLFSRWTRWHWQDLYVQPVAWYNSQQTRHCNSSGLPEHCSIVDAWWTHSTLPFGIPIPIETQTHCRLVCIPSLLCCIDHHSSQCHCDAAAWRQTALLQRW